VQLTQSKKRKPATRRCGLGIPLRRSQATRPASPSGTGMVSSPAEDLPLRLRGRKLRARTELLRDSPGEHRSELRALAPKTALPGAHLRLQPGHPSTSARRAPATAIALDGTEPLPALPVAYGAHDEDQVSPGCCGNSRPAGPCCRQPPGWSPETNRRGPPRFFAMLERLPTEFGARICRSLRDLDWAITSRILLKGVMPAGGKKPPGRPKNGQHPVVGGAPVRKRWKIGSGAPAQYDDRLFPPKLLSTFQDCWPAAARARTSPCRK